jgi:hypothetical protein
MRTDRYNLYSIHFFGDMPSAPAIPAIPVVIVERNGDLRASHIDTYTPMELSKKCKHKTSAGFAVRAEWAYSGTDDAADRFIVELWARDDGNAGQENKYEFPPPVDTILFFGACALVARDMTTHHRVIPLTLEKWDKMYDFLFGGFDTLANCDDDDNECDELDSVPARRKTKDGYLKDGFVVDNTSGEDDDQDDDDDDEDDEEEDDEDDEDDDDEDEEEDDEADECDAVSGVAGNSGAGGNVNANSGAGGKSNYGAGANDKPASRSAKCKRREKKQPKEDVLVDTSSELSEEAYEYLDD